MGQMYTLLAALWRNGSASDSRSEGCVFKSRQGHSYLTTTKRDAVKNVTIEIFINIWNVSLLVIIERRHINTKIFITWTLWAPTVIVVRNVKVAESLSCTRRPLIGRQSRHFQATGG